MRAVRLFVLAGLACLSLASNPAEFANDEEALMEAMRMSEALEEDEDSDFLRTCGVSYPPDENEINTCLELENTKECPYFDTSDCRPECLLGFEKDEYGCVVSCQCQNEGLFEGDIMVRGDQLPYFREAYGLASYARGASRRLGRWNKNPQGDTFFIPYVITSSIKDSRTLTAIKQAIAQYEEQTCLRFKPRRDERDYIKFIFGRGCYSYLGRIGGGQELSLGRYCWYKGIAMHEMMHAMGFYHEHSRPDRDDHVRIVSSNIKPAALYNFRKMTKNDVDSMGSPYDITSLMHYGGYDFSRDRRNRKATIVSRLTGQAVEKQRNGFTPEDLKQLNQMYGCKM